MANEAQEPASPDLDIAAIMKCIPHRYPFLLLDRLTRIQKGESAVGIKNVTINEPFFPGHFPSEPVMPGVLIVEAMAQAAAALVIHSLDLADRDPLVYFMSIENAKFRKPVRPGDRLELHVTKERERGAIWKFACEARVDGTKVTEAGITAMLRLDDA